MQPDLHEVWPARSVGLHVSRLVRWAACAVCALVLAACQQAAPRNPLAIWLPSDNYNDRRAQVIVLHYTAQESAQEGLHTLRTRNSDGAVSAHYLLDRDGTLYQLVSDAHRAWHAGAGSWAGMHDLNSASLGIELVNNGQQPFPEAQIAALIALLDDLTTRHAIPKTAVIGHSDLAPGRKIDPGPLFPWQRLYAAGYGIWPDPQAPPLPAGFDPVAALRLIGYATDDLPATIASYRMRFRGDNAQVLDADDAAILHGLTWLRPAAQQ